MTSEVKISDDGKGKRQSIAARWTLDVLGGMGIRNVDLTGWGGALSRKAASNFSFKPKRLTMS